MKRRLDLELVARGLADSRSRAQLLIKEERVEVAGETVGAPAYKVDAETPIRITDPLPYVSRAALKLRAALDRFAIDVAGAICLDIGASTGGFTQLLVERGAARVYAVDVGHGQMHPKVLGLPQVRSFEGVNARNLTAEQVREPVDLIVCDASFISLKKVLPTPLGLAGPRAHLVALVKPQFEVGRQAAGDWLDGDGNDGKSDPWRRRKHRISDCGAAR